MNPSTRRWRPRRAGVINLYEYADQVFEFAGGRLLLRGHNTSGKTKALELLLPYCLDGDVSPNKLDPFGGAYKDMKWNLVGCTGDEKRVGYVWLEFERLTAGGDLERLTAGIGMRANKALPDVTRWYFLARNRTVGTDLSLLRGRDPISRADLCAALGEDGEVLDSQRDYRARLRDLLFGFTGEEQYQTMLRLMRDLRRPHLSKTLDPDRVAEQLSVGLPEVDETLMRRLAGGLEQIETLERGLARLRDVRERVRRFHQRTYGAYARAIVRERADELRQAETAVDNAAERTRVTRTELETQTDRAVTATTERNDAEATVTRLSAERDGIVQSAAWSSVAEVEALREHAATQVRAAAAAAEHAGAAEAAVAAGDAELITAQAAVADHRRLAESDLAKAQAMSSRAGLEARTALLVGQLRDASMAADSWSGLLRDLAADWSDVLHHHGELLEHRRVTRDDAAKARADERAAADRADATRSELSRAEQALEDVRTEFTRGYDDWRAGLTELSLNDEAASTALHLAHSGRPVIPALTAAARSHRAGLDDDLAATRAARSAAADDAAVLDAEIDHLAAARDDGPAPPQRPRAERPGRPGAPLWRLVDFRDHLTADARAACEAALEAAGILDAWVTPDGELTDTALADVFLKSGAPLSDPTLLDALVPVADQPVASGVVAELLRSIGFGERHDAPWVDVTGRFAAGPIAGRGTKPVAEHIGAAAREARRAGRIAELHRRRGVIEDRIVELDAIATALTERRATLDVELSTVPEIEPILAALDATRVGAALDAAAAREHEHATAAARAAADAELAADRAQREHASGHGLPPSLDQAQLADLRVATAELTGAAAAVARSWSVADRAAAACVTMAQRLDSEREAAHRVRERARDETVEAERLTAQHTTREAALGATGEELRQRHTVVLAGLKRARDTERHAREIAEAARVEAARLSSELSARDSELEAARASRAAAALGVRQLGTSSILRLVLRDAVPQDVERAAEWTVTRCLEVVRALPAELMDAHASAGERAVEVQRGVQLLDRELGDADMSAYAIRGDDGLLMVHVTEGGSDQSLADILDTLAAEITDREQVLSAEERRVFNDALVAEIADHLRGRIHAVRERVDSMNAVLRHSPTAAGKTVELEWHPLDNDAGTQRAALALLRRDVRQLDEAGREELISFFRDRIESVRRDHGVGGQPRAMSATLMAGFDYRRWFKFGLFERSGAGRIQLTKQRHAVGSGGEQSVLIHLPLFAAAAALYGESDAPRLVMLDEALSGIDDETRERVLKATVDFDLDVVMTSHELWGTYRSVPQLSIYQLHRDNGVFGVHAVQFLWDGDVLRELEQSELLV
jgi:uncharacterized protein (TIGR02680 family)